jgi:hypothetical protein
MSCTASVTGKQMTEETLARFRAGEHSGKVATLIVEFFCYLPEGHTGPHLAHNQFANQEIMWSTP